MIPAVLLTVNRTSVHLWNMGLQTRIGVMTMRDIVPLEPGKVHVAFLPLPTGQKVQVLAMLPIRLSLVLNSDLLLKGLKPLQTAGLSLNLNQHTVLLKGTTRPVSGVVNSHVGEGLVHVIREIANHLKPHPL